MKFIFLSFFYARGAGNPPGGSGDTRDRFYIDKKKEFFDFSFIFIFISILLINVPWMA